MGLLLSVLRIPISYTRRSLHGIRCTCTLHKHEIIQRWIYFTIKYFDLNPVRTMKY